MFKKKELVLDKQAEGEYRKTAGKLSKLTIDPQDKAMSAQSAFRRRVVDFDGVVVALAQPRRPEFERVQDCRRRVGFAHSMC